MTNMPTIDSVEINSVLFQDPCNIQIDELHQTTKVRPFSMLTCTQLTGRAFVQAQLCK